MPSRNRPKQLDHASYGVILALNNRRHQHAGLFAGRILQLLCWQEHLPGLVVPL
jgi:hypothetical protein